MSVKGIVAEQRCRRRKCVVHGCLSTLQCLVCVCMDVCVDMHGQEQRRKLQNKPG